MRLLGAIVAGGRASRFGADKGAALLDGLALIDHITNGLAGQVDAMIIVGREWPGVKTVADRPRAGIGPLGGLCGALHHAAGHGYDAVAMMPCDLLPVPDFTALAPGPAVIAGHPICGLWPTRCLVSLERFIASAPMLSMKEWVAESDAAEVQSGQNHVDANTLDALYRLAGFRNPGA